MPLPTRRIEAAFGHTWLEDPSTMGFVDLFAATTADPHVIERGRTSEREQDRPATLTVAFNDPTRALDPNNLQSPFRSRVVSWGATGYLSGPDIALGDETLDARVRVRELATGAYTLLGQWGGVGNQSWRLHVGSGNLSFVGATGVGLTLPVETSGAEWVWVRALVDFTAATNVVTLFISEDDVRDSRGVTTWTQLVDGGTGPVAFFDSTAPVTVGANADGSGPVGAVGGQIAAAQLFMDGNLAMSLVFDTTDATGASTDSFADETGGLWSVEGDAGYADLGSLVRPDVPIRVVDEIPADDVRFYGFVDDWQPVYERAKTHMEVAVTATDITKMLGRAPVPESVLALEIANRLGTSTSQRWYRLAERSGSQMVDSSPNAVHGIYDPGTTALSTRNPGEYESSPAIAFDGAHQGTAAYTDNPPLALFLTVEDIDEAPAVTQVLANVRGTAIYLETDGTVSGDPGEAFGGTARISHPAVVTDGEPHVIHFNDSTNELWVDGVVSTTTASSRGTGGGLQIPGSPAFSGATLPTVTMANVVVNVGDAAVLAAAFLAPWDADRVDERIERLAEFVGVPDSLLDLDVCQGIMGPAQFGPNVYAFDLIEEAAHVEQGRLGTRRQGALFQHSRYHGIVDSEATTVQLQIVDELADETGDVWAYSTLVPDSGGAMVRTSASGETPDGTPVSYQDPDAVQRHGIIDDPLGRLVTSSASQAEGVLRLRVARYKDARPRYPEVGLFLHRRPANAAVVAAVDLGQRVRLNDTPMGVGSEIEFDGIVESLRETRDRFTWRIDMALSPAEAVPNIGLWDEGLWDEAEWGV